MTQEEYEAKVQSMPSELQNQFRQSLEINLSKRIVNRFMSTVMQAYAWGQRVAQTGEGSQNAAYMRGAQDMKDAIETVSNMSAEEVYNYCFHSCSNHLDGLYMTISQNSVSDIFAMARSYAEDKENKKKIQEVNNVKTIADTIGIEKLCEIANEIRKQKAAEGECLPF